MKDSKIKLSILTPSVPSRFKTVSGLHDDIQMQIELHGLEDQVEHLIFTDNKNRSIGAKRQALVDIARGEYVAFVDDDDQVTGNYVKDLVEATKDHPDVITFRQHSSYNGKESTVAFGLKNDDENYNEGGETKRGAWHVCAWKRSLVRGCLFPESNYGEDRIWSLQARARVMTEKHVPKVLHSYIHSAETTEAPEAI